MKQHLRIWLSALAIMPILLFAQSSQPVINSVLSGQVIDTKTGAPLEGASISIKGTTHNIVTDTKGRFTFRTGQKLPYELIVSYIGYKTQELIVSTDDVTVKLEELSSQLQVRIYRYHYEY